MKKYALIIIGFIFLTSCETKPSPIPTTKYKNLVLQYIEPLSLAGSSPGVVIEGWHDVEQGKRIDVVKISIDVKGEIREDFESLSEYYQDTEYNKDREFEGIQPIYIALSKAINNITVVCDKDYNSNHPAGSLLNDIINFGGKSAYHAIQSGYNERQYPELINRRDPPSQFYPIYKTLDKVVVEDLKLLFPLYIELIITKIPEESGIFTFTVTFELEDGEKLVSVIKSNITLPA